MDMNESIGGKMIRDIVPIDEPCEHWIKSLTKILVL